VPGRYVSGSYIARLNLTTRMGLRRCSRLTNGFSKKSKNPAAAVSFHFIQYNFARPRRSPAGRHLRTPAMAAGVADRAWKLKAIVELLTAPR
jgi:hypothetical protein